MRTEPTELDLPDPANSREAARPPAPLLAGEDENEAEPHILRGLD
ncbi:surface protein [Streptomyces fragilis]|uniref:Surface protein n=1 Tax=Streptomyces fragilis TaxID=67301 RepID=A0ABV2YF17_9ACTN|nr:surface protein [Streptomyces fragilis]